MPFTKRFLGGLVLTAVFFVPALSAGGLFKSPSPHYTYYTSHPPLSPLPSREGKIGKKIINWIAGAGATIAAVDDDILSLPPFQRIEGVPIGVSFLDVAYKGSDKKSKSGNIYFLVWAANIQKGEENRVEVKGQVRDSAGNIIAGGDEGFVISAGFGAGDPCLPEDFFLRFSHPDIDFEASDFTKPVSCSYDLFPAVAYNAEADVFRVVWQRVVSDGRAWNPDGGEARPFEFSVILARDYRVNAAGDAMPEADLPEIINRYYFMANLPNYCPDGETLRSADGPCDEKFVLEDMDILAWSTARFPDIASGGGDYFLVAYETNVPAFGRGDLQDSGGPAGGGWEGLSELEELIQDYGIQLRPLRAITPPYPEPYTYHDDAEVLSLTTSRPKVAYSPTNDKFLVAYDAFNRNTANKGIYTILADVGETEGELSVGAGTPREIADTAEGGIDETKPAVVSHEGYGGSSYLVPFEFLQPGVSGIRGTLVSSENEIVNFGGTSSHDIAVSNDTGDEFGRKSNVDVAFSAGLPAGDSRHIIVYQEGIDIKGVVLDGDLEAFHPFLISAVEGESIASKSPAVVYNPEENEFYVAWLSLRTGIASDEFAGVEDRIVSLDDPQGTFTVTPSSEPLRSNGSVMLEWDIQGMTEGDYVTIEGVGLDPGASSPFVDAGGDPVRYAASGTEEIADVFPGSGEVTFRLTIYWRAGETVLVSAPVTITPYRDPAVDYFDIYRPGDAARTSIDEAAVGETVRIEWDIDFEEGDIASIEVFKRVGEEAEELLYLTLSQAGFRDDVPSADREVAVRYRLVATGSSGREIEAEKTINVASLPDITLTPVPDPLAPTRAYLEWSLESPLDGVTYDVYFIETAGSTIPAGTLPYKSGVEETHFVIQSSTDGRAQFNPDTGVTPIYLGANNRYCWKVVAERGGLTSESEVNCFDTDDSVLAWWRFDEGSGRTAHDYSENGNDGELRPVSGGPTWISTDTGSALQFNGVDDYVIVGDNPSLEGMSSLTIDVWLRTDSVATNRVVVSKWYSGVTSYILDIQETPGQLRFATMSAGPSTCNSLTRINDGNWHHVVGTYDSDSTNQGLFIDGSLEATSSQTGTIADSTEEVCIGSSCNAGIAGGDNLNGIIDDVLVYNRALTTALVTNNYCSMKALSISEPLPTVCGP